MIRSMGLACLRVFAAEAKLALGEDKAARGEKNRNSQDQKWQIVDRCTKPCSGVQNGIPANMFSVLLFFTLRMKRLWVPGFSLALILLSGLAFAQSQQSASFQRRRKRHFRSSVMGWGGNNPCITPPFRQPT